MLPVLAAVVARVVERRYVNKVEQWRRVPALHSRDWDQGGTEGPLYSKLPVATSIHYASRRRWVTGRAGREKQSGPLAGTTPPSTAERNNWFRRTRRRNVSASILNTGLVG